MNLRGWLATVSVALVAPTMWASCGSLAVGQGQEGLLQVESECRRQEMNPPRQQTIDCMAQIAEGIAPEDADVVYDGWEAGVPLENINVFTFTSSGLETCEVNSNTSLGGSDPETTSNFTVEVRGPSAPYGCYV